jgi:hypothetical protein
MTVVAFIAKWRKVELKERSATHEHFIDLCAVLGHETLATADPLGSDYRFEKGATKLDSEDGWADVWKRGYFAWEYSRRKLAFAHRLRPHSTRRERRRARQRGSTYDMTLVIERGSGVGIGDVKGENGSVSSAYAWSCSSIS